MNAGESLNVAEAPKFILLSSLIYSKMVDESPRIGGFFFFA